MFFLLHTALVLDFFSIPFLSIPLLEQGQIDVRSSKPLVKEDDVDRDARRRSAEKQKSTKDSANKRREKENIDRQALEARRAKSRQRGEPKGESPSDDDGGDGGDESDDSEGMASRLDRILEGPPRGDVDAPRMEVPKEGLGGSHHPRADTPLCPRLVRSPRAFPLRPRWVAMLGPRRRGH